jgi:hypothetical protein
MGDAVNWIQYVSLWMLIGFIGPSIAWIKNGPDELTMGGVRVFVILSFMGPIGVVWYLLENYGSEDTVIWKRKR